MYVMLIIYITASASHTTVNFHEAFDSMKECQARFNSWKVALSSQFISGACYYRGKQNGDHTKPNPFIQRPGAFNGL
jgi:hypothetical protein